MDLILFKCSVRDFLLFWGVCVCVCKKGRGNSQWFSGLRLCAQISVLAGFRGYVMPGTEPGSHVRQAHCPTGTISPAPYNIIYMKNIIYKIYKYIFIYKYKYNI